MLGKLYQQLYLSPQVFIIEKNPINKFHKDILLTYRKMSLIRIEDGAFSLKD